MHDTQIRTHESFVTYHVCQRCGFTMKDASAFLKPDAEKAQYDFHENTPENAGYVAMFEQFIDTVITPFIPPTRVLDFGCGPGPVLIHCLRKRGYDAVGYDPFYQPDKTVLAKRYPLIVSTEVFEHFNEPLKTIELLDSLLEKKGYLAVMTRLRPKDDRTFLDWWYRRDSTHVAFYTLEAFQHLAEQCRWRLVHTDASTYLLFQKLG